MRLAPTALVSSISLLLGITATGAHPTLVECVCNTTTSDSAVISSSTPASRGKAAIYVVPSCLNDVFGETGIRWYINGPVQAGITYWRKDPVAYASGRAAMRMISLGYRCTAHTLYDPNELVYYT